MPFTSGHFISKLPCPEALKAQIKETCENRDWHQLDKIFKELTLPSGLLFQHLRTFKPFTHIEFIISKRTAGDNEEGIWHDDGSRLMAFSLSLTPNPEHIEGGLLELRPKGTTPSLSLKTPTFLEMTIFQTGVDGFEHKINQVIKGERLIIAGWCS